MKYGNTAYQTLQHATKTVARGKFIMPCACMLHSFSHVRLFATLWTIAYQAPLSMGFSRQEYWSGLPRPPPGDLPNPGIEPTSLAFPALQADSLPTEPPGKPIYSDKHL